ncbi:MAG: hypothetical protein ABIQ65_08295 [Thermoanaerobaculia bacterium]
MTVVALSVAGGAVLYLSVPPVQRALCRVVRPAAACQTDVIERLSLYEDAGAILPDLGEPTTIVFSTDDHSGDHYVYLNDVYALDLEVRQGRVATFFVIGRAESFHPEIAGVTLGAPIDTVTADLTNGVDYIEADASRYVETLRQGDHFDCYGASELGFLRDRDRFIQQLASLRGIFGETIKGAFDEILRNADGTPSLRDATSTQRGVVSQFRRSVPMNAVGVTIHSEQVYPCAQLGRGLLARALE